MPKFRNQWSQPRWFIIHSTSGSFSISSRHYPKTTDSTTRTWLSVEGPFNLKREADAEIRRQRQERTENLVQGTA